MNKDNNVTVHSKDLHNQIKSILKQEKMNFTILKFTINELFNKTDSVRNLYNKFKRETLRVSELEEIAEILNYELVLRPKS